MDRLKNQIQRYWNWRSASYKMDRVKSIETVSDWKSTINDLVSHVRGEGLKALDVGTGPGQLAFYLAQAGKDIETDFKSYPAFDTVIQLVNPCNVSGEFW